MPNTIPQQYPTPTLISGNLRTLSATASSAASNTKVRSGVLNLTGQWGRVYPETLADTAVGAAQPAEPFVYDSIGWQMDTAILGNATDTGLLLAGSVTVTINITPAYTGGNQAVSFMTKLFVNGVEIGTSPFQNPTYYLSSATVNQTNVVTIPSNVAIPAGGKLQMLMFTVLVNDQVFNNFTVTINYTSTGTLIPAAITYNAYRNPAISDSITTSEASTRALVNSRIIPDTVIGTEISTIVANYPRTIPGAVIGTEVSSRVVSFVKNSADTISGIDVLSRLFRLSRTTPDTVAAIEAATRVNNFGRFINDGAVNDPIVRFAGKFISGITRDQAGAVLGSCTVKLIRQSDDFMCQVTTSDATTGVYSFSRDIFDTNIYYVISYKASPEIHGISDRSLLPV